jgi:TolA-binding protein
MAGRLSAQQPKPEVSAWQTEFEKARDLFLAGKYVEALAAFQKFEAANKFSTAVPDAIYYEGWCWFNQSRHQEAANVFDHLLEGYPTSTLVPETILKKAECYRELKQYEEASVVYRHLLEKYPNDKVAEQANFGLIQTLVQRGEHEKAGAETEAFKRRYPRSLLLENTSLIQAEAVFGQKNYRDALPLYQKSLAGAKDAQLAETVEFRIASCYFNLEQFDKARDAFAALPRKYPQGKLVADALLHLGLTYYEIATRSTDPKVTQPSLVEAAKAYEEIRVKHPQVENVPDATFYLGKLYSFLGDYDKSIAMFQELAQKWPAHDKTPEAMFLTARAQLSAKRFDNAVGAYRAMLEKFPDHDFAPFAAFEIASAHADAKRFPEMVEALRDYVRRYPNHGKVGDALYAIGTQLEAQKKNDEAIAAYRDLVDRAAKADPLTDELRNSAIGAQLRISALLDVKPAIFDCEGALAKFANDPTAARAMVSQIAVLYRKDKLAAEGCAKLDQLAQQYQANAAIRVACATSTIDLALGEKDFIRAGAAAAKLLADPEHDKLPAASYVAIGNVFLKTEKFAQARDAFEKVQLPVGQLGLGQALFELKQYDAAETALNEIPAPTPPDADLTLAKVHESKGKLKEAVDLYNKVLQSGRGEIGVEASYRLGNIFFNMTDPVKSKDNKKTALAYFARLLFATGPMAEEAAYRAGECHEALGNKPQACTTFQGYVKRFPTGKFVEEAKSKIARLCATQT